jgi:hypothetical protein
MVRLADFIIMGAMKSATSTLQEQLACQPGIFMCVPKEPNFFSDDDKYSKGMDWYSGLFSSAPAGSLLGEASTHYTKLPTYPDTIDRLKKHLPHARFIYVMRHPVDRLISHYIHEWSMDVYRCNIEKAVEQFSELIAYGRYAFQLEPYFEAYGRDAVLPVFFDRLICEPQFELERICRHIKYAGKPLWAKDFKPSNVSKERLWRFPLFNILVESRMSSYVRRKFVPQGWRDFIKSKIVMDERPELEPGTLSKLKEEFNSDLSVLGNHLGVDLNCDNFKEVTSTQLLNWTGTN